MSFVIVLISKRGYLKTTENKSSCQPIWVACKKNDLTEKSCPNRLGLDLKRMQGIYRTEISLFPMTGEFVVVLFASAFESFPIPTIFILGLTDNNCSLCP